MSDGLTREERDRQLLQLASTYTDLDKDDIRLLLDVSHGLPFIGNLERGDTYINVLTRDGKSMVVAQYRHPDCDLYGRDIIGEIERREDEPAVYRALEYGISGRGLIGIIDSGKTVVRHTVSPIFNDRQKVIGSLTYEYLNTGSDTEPVRVVNTDGKASDLRYKMNRLIGSIQDGFLIFDACGICTVSNSRAEMLYREAGYTGTLDGKTYEELRLEGRPEQKEIIDGGTVRSEVKVGRYVLEETISSIWENEKFQGTVVIMQDRTRIRQLEDELQYRSCLIQEVHHRVKNNLQTIIGLIGLEASQKKGWEVKEFSKTITGYIRSISITYDLLAHTNAEFVDMKTMLSRVIDSVLEGYRMGECIIRMEINGESLALPEHKASTVSLIVNELVTNSMKYAFCGRKEGKISLTMETGKEYAWLTVKDDGLGIDSSDRHKSSGLGLRLVENLVKSILKGEFSIGGSEGTTARFSVRL